jgi:enamine deaminase RidA (YjgF/YER057c/UK114 family)
MDIDRKLQELKIELPTPPKPIAAYVPAVRSGKLLIVSGQLPMLNGELIATGSVPHEVDIDKAQTAARQCVLNALAIIREQVRGDWSKVRRILRIGVFVQSADDFHEQSTIANGASDLLVELFEEVGRHARAAVGVNALPLNAPVEVEVMAELIEEGT